MAKAHKTLLAVAGTTLLVGIMAACSGNGGGDPTPTATPTPQPSPLFETFVVPLFYSQCGAESSGCHSRAVFVADSSDGCRGLLALEDVPLGAEVYAGSNMGLSTGCPDLPLYERLMTMSSQCDTSMKPHVTPGSLSSSYLFNKIAGGPYCPLEDGVTPSGPMPFDSPIDDPDDIDRLRDWILTGAPRQQ